MFFMKATKISQNLLVALILTYLGKTATPTLLIGIGNLPINLKRSLLLNSKRVVCILAGKGF